MKQIELTAHSRTRSGKNAAKAIRKLGRVPAVLYSKGDSLMLELDARETTRLLSGHEGQPVVNIKVTGDTPQEYLAMVTEVQKDVFQKVLYHIDFHQVSMDEMVQTTVAIHFQGHPAGERTGGVTEHVRREIEIEATPLSIPRHIVVDVSEVEVGKGLYVRDILPPTGVRFLSDPDELVVMVHPPRTVEELTPAATEAGAEVPAAAAPAKETP